MFINIEYNMDGDSLYWFNSDREWYTASDFHVCWDFGIVFSTDAMTGELLKNRMY